MKLARFHTGDGEVRLGRVDGAEIVDLSGIAGIGSSLRMLIGELDARRDSILASDGARHPLSDVTLLAPIDDPQKFLGIGMNYAEHAEEARQAGIPIPTSQMWFNKQVSCINDPFGDIVRPVVSEQLDYEIELGVVIGKPARNVSAEDAREYIAGYLVTNDVSIRDWLAKLSPTFTLGKSFDTHGPIGPWLTTDDEIADPLKLQMTLTVNGEVRQSADTSDMIYDIYEQIAYLSQVMTLQPGDILATGTPSGIGAPTQNWLVPGDVVHAEIKGLGAIENRVVGA
ncbi:fumarylacetoacetate hydrolase family protein [Microbacterium sp. A204]|uniref:fumarylacetoacetate hydrolase family protein n=1 Tax=Microbacterium sp. A204 TaxID=3457321 RepID=UPI003FD17028